MVWKHSGYVIEVNSEGRFISKVEGDDIIGTTLQECRTNIEAAVKGGKTKKIISLPVVGFLEFKEYHSRPDNTRDLEIFHSKVVGINRTTRELLCLALPTNYDLKGILPDTPEAVEFLERYVAHRKEEKLMRSVMNQWLLGGRGHVGHGRVDPGAEYNNLVAELEARYKKAAGFTLEKFLNKPLVEEV